MRKLFLVIGLFISFLANAQPTTRYLGTPNELIYIRGLQKTDSALAIPNDTLRRSTWSSSDRYLSAKGDSLWLWSSTNGRFVLVSGSGGAGEVTQAALDDTTSDLRIRYNAAYTSLTQVNDTMFTFTDFNGIPDTVTISLANGDKGDIDVAAGWNQWTVDTNAITTVKIADGAVTNDKLAGSIAQTKVTGLTDSIAAKQQKILWQDEASDLGVAGSIDTVNITGTGATATRSNSKLTIDVSPSGMDSIEIVAYDTLSTKNLWINSTTNRMGYRIDSFIYHLAITDSVRYVYAGGSSYDADAQAYFDAVDGAGGSLTTQQKDAYNDFVLELKAASIFSTHFDFIHLLMGGSEAAVKFNLIDPTDADASHRLTFPNSATFATTGVTTNGTNQYINTHFIPANTAVGGNSDHHLSIYHRSSAGALGFSWGVLNGTNTMYGAVRYQSDDLTYVKQINSAELTFADGTSGKGFYMTNIKSTNAPPVMTTHKDGVQKLGGAEGGSGNTLPAAYNLTFQAWNNNGTIGQYRADEISLISFGKGMTPTERAAYETAVANLITALGL